MIPKNNTTRRIAGVYQPLRPPWAAPFRRDLSAATASAQDEANCAQRRQQRDSSRLRHRGNPARRRVVGIGAVAVIAYVILRLSASVVAFIGTAGMNAITKVMGFLLLCIGIQFIVNGVLGIATDPAIVRSIRDAAAGSPAR